jgi:excisionase family DNA binding protein
MAGMFYSIKEVAEKLGKSEDEVRQLVKAGQLREFRDGPNLLFKVDEVTALMSDTGLMEASKHAEKPAAPKTEEEAEVEKSVPAGKGAAPTPETEAEAEEILLAPETPSKPGEEIQLTDADTQIVEEGIKVLGETDTAEALGDTGGETFKGLSGTPAAGKEASLEEIEKDVSLDTFGSGSGLLDLSLQADDTSLGGILDEIYTPGGEGKVPAAAAAPAAGSAEGSAMEVAAEADQILAEGQFPEMPVAPAVGLAPQAYVEPEPDAMSNAMGVMLFIPLLAVIYTAIIAVAGFSNMIPAVLKPVQGFMWYYIVPGLVVASALILGIGKTMGGEKKPKAPKPLKVKKEKPPKVKKEKPPKEKKGK